MRARVKAGVLEPLVCVADVKITMNFTTSNSQIAKKGDDVMN